MRTYLTAQSLSISLASFPLFEDITFTLNQGDRIGLIGHNGCGKSTLLKVLSSLQDDVHGHNFSGHDFSGKVIQAKSCKIAYVEQHLPASLTKVSLFEALAERLDTTAPSFAGTTEQWRTKVMLNTLGFHTDDWQRPVSVLSGGQHMRLLLARAIITEPDLLLLDEPSNHLDLPALLWLEHFLRHWSGSFVLVSHDQQMLEQVTNTTWIMRDQTLHCFNLPCRQARTALAERDEADKLRRRAEQKEIDRIDKSAKRLAEWGKVYDNEGLARKAKTMQARKARLEATQTQRVKGAPWRLILQGDALPANRLFHLERYDVIPQGTHHRLFEIINKQVKSGDRVAILGPNGCGKSTLLKQLFHDYHTQRHGLFHPQCQLGYYDQSLAQLHDADTLSAALVPFATVNDDIRKQALISAGFAYARHSQTVASLSGGERARLLFIGLTLARYHLLFLDEPTNHLDLAGKEELIATLNQYPGGALIVSHDRNLIEQSCNRFWLIQDGTLQEHHDPAVIYQRMMQPISTQGDEIAPSSPQTQEATALRDEETLLAQLIALEQRLADDLARKPKFQKPALQVKWREEIKAIHAQL